jgi:CRP-like cAMP-binding protein
MLETKNILLQTLATKERQLLAAKFDKVEMKRGDMLYETYKPIEFVYFFESGLSSEITCNDDGKRIEVGCVGREGLSGVPVLLGLDQTPQYAFMQTEGKVLRIRSTDLQEAMDDMPNLRRILLRYVHVFMIQIAATALADGRYSVEQRLARWLLMSQDRLGGELPLTHEFLGLMLGVRRPSVTDALHVLEGRQLIKAERGLISVRDRHKLEDLAGDCYGRPEREYQRLILDGDVQTTDRPA